MQQTGSEFCVVGHSVCEAGVSASCSGEEWHVEEFGVSAARAEFGVDGAGRRVAVLDTGVAADHPRLAGRVTAHDYTASREGAGDDDGHGTHVCGIVSCVAPGAEVHSFRVFGASGRAVRDNILSALRDIRDEKHGRFDVVNLSLGGGAPDAEMRMLLLGLNARGAFVCCAAGNGSDHSGAGAPRFGTVDWPAGFNCTLAVGSMDREGRRSPYSSSGPTITVMAPGEGVLSCWKDGTMARLSGTSMAAPFVSGVVLLALHACEKRGRPRPDWAEMLHAMASSSCDMEEAGFDFFTGYGRLAPAALLRALVGRPPRYGGA